MSGAMSINAAYGRYTTPLFLAKDVAE